MIAVISSRSLFVALTALLLLALWLSVRVMKGKDYSTLQKGGAGIARRRLSGGKHLHRLKPRPGYIRAAHALEVVQGLAHAHQLQGHLELLDHRRRIRRARGALHGGGLEIGELSGLRGEIEKGETAQAEAELAARRALPPAPAATPQRAQPPRAVPCC